MLYKADKMGVPGAYFADRWMLDFGLFSIRLHRWTGSDDPRAMHDHPAWFFTLVLWGGYDDVNDCGIDKLRFLSVRFRRADYRHTVQNRARHTWTLLVFGKQSRRWAFFPKGKRVTRDKYFAEHGHHTAGGAAIRLRPDGSRIAA